MYQTYQCGVYTSVITSILVWWFWLYTCSPRRVRGHFVWNHITAVLGNNASFPSREPDRRRLRWSAALSEQLTSPFTSLSGRKDPVTWWHGNADGFACFSQLSVSASTGCKLSDGAGWLLSCANSSPLSVLVSSSDGCRLRHGTSKPLSHWSSRIFKVQSHLSYVQ